MRGIPSAASLHQQHAVEAAEADLARHFQVAMGRQVDDAVGQRTVGLPCAHRLLRRIVEQERPIGPSLDQQQRRKMNVHAQAVGQQAGGVADVPVARFLFRFDVGDEDQTAGFHMGDDGAQLGQVVVVREPGAAQNHHARREQCGHANHDRLFSMARQRHRRYGGEQHESQKYHEPHIEVVRALESGR